MRKYRKNIILKIPGIPIPRTKTGIANHILNWTIGANNAMKINPAIIKNIEIIKNKIRDSTIVKMTIFPMRK